MYAQGFQDEGTDNAAEDADGNDNDGCQRGNASGLGRYIHGNRCGDGLGLDGGDQGFVSSHPFADEDDTDDAYYGTDEDGGEDGDHIPLQVLYLIVEDVTQSDYRGTQQEMDQMAVLLEFFILDTQRLQDQDENTEGGDHRMEQEEMALLVEEEGGQVGADDKGQRKQFGMQEDLHLNASFGSLPFQMSLVPRLQW